MFQPAPPDIPSDTSSGPFTEVADALLPDGAPWLDALTRTLNEAVAQNTFGDYVLAAGVGLAVFAVLWGLKLGLLLLLRRGGAATNPRSRFAVAHAVVARTWTFYLILVALLAGAATLVLPDGLMASLRIATLVLFFVQVGRWGSALLGGFVDRYAAIHSDSDPQATTGLSIARLIGAIIVWSVVLLLILDNLGVDVTALVAGLGIGGIAIGLAAQNVLGDLFGSLAIVMDKPFVRGDFIVLSDDHMGTVERIGLKTTRIRSLSGEQLVVANTDLLTSRIRNYKRMSERRISFSLGVIYQTPHEKIRRIPEIIKQIVDATDGARLDRSNFSGYGDSALTFETIWFVTTADYNRYMDIQEQIYLAIHKAFEAEGIDFAYPTRTLFVEGIEAAREAGADTGDETPGKPRGD